MSDKEILNIKDKLLKGLHIIPGHYMIIKTKEFGEISEILYKNKQRKAEY